MRSSPAGAGCKGRASWPNAPSIPRVPAFTAARWPTPPHTSSPRMRSLLAPPAPPAPGPAPAPCPTRTPTAKRGAGERAQPPHPPSSTHRAAAPACAPQDAPASVRGSARSWRAAITTLTGTQLGKLQKDPGNRGEAGRAGGRLPSLKPSRLPQQHQVTTGGIWNLRDDLEEGRTGL